MSVTIAAIVTAIAILVVAEIYLLRRGTSISDQVRGLWRAPHLIALAFFGSGATVGWLVCHFSCDLP